jgi:hypothetical protein
MFSNYLGSTMKRCLRRLQGCAHIPASHYTPDMCHPSQALPTAACQCIHAGGCGALPGSHELAHVKHAVRCHAPHAASHPTTEHPSTGPVDTYSSPIQHLLPRFHHPASDTAAGGNRPGGPRHGSCMVGRQAPVTTRPTPTYTFRNMPS